MAFTRGLLRNGAFAACHCRSIMPGYPMERAPSMPARQTAPQAAYSGRCTRRSSASAARRAASTDAASAASTSGRGAPAAAASLSCVVTSESGMRRLAAALARELRAGDVYLLYGSVGAGKSAFSRAFIRAAAEDPSLPVPSPTFLLQQIYEEHEGPPIHHFDLYRLEPAAGLARLGLAASFSGAVSLIEWPERLLVGGAPAERLELRLEIVGEAEQRQLEAAWRAAGGDGQEGGCGGGASSGASSSSEWSDAEGSADEEDEDPYTDRRWRRVRADALGERWARRLDALRALAGGGGLSARVRLVAEGAAGGALQNVPCPGEQQ
ncbi:MAG: hypothetical protein J3K34DRAFT_413790 [Monoraphidium minutum]|nr:MAG: hypothetical protein J3K34DRAFT_413790 [Monoraphidium minutum]